MLIADLIIVVGKVTALLLLVAATAVMTRRASAAKRHMLWMGGLGAALALPALAILLPQWRVATWSPRVFALASASTPAVRGGAWADAWGAAVTGVLAIWAIGVLLALAWILAGELWVYGRSRHRAAHMSREWREAIDASRGAFAGLTPVRFVECAWLDAPCTWGVARPIVLLPECGRGWTAVERRCAVTHELAHIARGDLAANLVARLACAVHWYHPLVWLAARAARLAREEACDNVVLESDARASDYAALLLSLGTGRRLSAAGHAASVGLARRAMLGHRLRALLDERRDRSRPRQARLVFALAFAFVSGVAIAAPAPAQERSQVPSAPSEEAELGKLAKRLCEGRRPGQQEMRVSVVLRDSAQRTYRRTLSVRCNARPRV